MENPLKYRKFLDSLRVDERLYRFSKGNPPTMIASALSVMLLQLIDELKFFSEDQKRAWADYFNSFQNEDGFFEDEDIDEKNLMPGYTKERALFHRTRHVLFALMSLGYPPKNSFKFLEEMKSQSILKQWLKKQDLSNYWDVSNKIMDLGLFLTYEAKVHKDEKARKAIYLILDSCDEHTNPKTGYHDAGKSELRNAMAGAMHVYPLYFLWNRKPKFPQAVIQTTLSLQNEDGLFGYEVGSGGEDCLDYDAVNILTNFYFIDKTFSAQIESAFEKLLEGINVCVNPDGGFCCHRRNETYRFGTFSTEVEIGGSSLWSTYARLVTIAMAAKVAGGSHTMILGNNLMEIYDGGKHEYTWSRNF